MKRGGGRNLQSLTGLPPLLTHRCSPLSTTFSLHLSLHFYTAFSTAFTKINNNFNELYAGNFVSPTSLASNLISAQDGTHDLGSATNQWGDLHVKDFIYLGGKKLSMSAGGALLVNNGIVQVTDLVGSVFADDSKLMMDGLTGILYCLLYTSDAADE